MVTYAFFSPNVASRRYALLEKKTPLSVRRCAGGVGGLRELRKMASLKRALFFQVQLNTSNKLGETPIKTAAMAGKVNKLQTIMQ